MQYIYEGIKVKQDDGKYVAVILRSIKNQPNKDTVGEFGPCDEADAVTWINQQLRAIEEKR